MSTWLAMLKPRIGSESPAVVTDTVTWTGAELMERAAGAADWLDGLGAHPADPVPCLLGTSASAFALAIGAAGSNRPVAPLGPRLTVDELTGCVERLAGELLVSEPAYADVAGKVAERTGRRLAFIGEFMPSARPLDLDGPPSQIGAILHTSGTTGLPKAVPYHLGGLAARTRVNGALLDLGPGSLYASSSPFHHIAGVGLLFVALGAGAAVLTFPGFSVDNWRDLGRRGVTHAQLVPTMIDILLEAGALPLPDLRIIQYGASPIHPETLAAALAEVPKVGFVQLYGQTEGSPITCLPPEDHVHALDGHPEILASVGRPAPGIELYIDAPDDNGVGEIVARGEHLFLPGPDGWLHTGDLGRIDANGYVYLVGRRGDKIIRGGENVYPLEVEHVIETHPAVAEAAVVGVPDRRWGEIVRAVVVPAVPGENPDPAELAAFTRQRLSGFKVPVVWDFVEALPRNHSGKLLRRLL